MTGTACNLADLAAYKNMSSAQLIDLVKQGINVGAFSQVASCLQVPEIELAKVLEISASTLTRRKREGKFRKYESELVLRVIEIFNKALDVFESESRAKRWMHTQNRALGGKTPLAYADTERGAREVEHILGRIEHGVYS